MSLIVILVALLIPSLVISQANYSFVTNPSSEAQPIYVISKEGASVSLYCFVFNEDAGTNGEHIQSFWQSKRTVDNDFVPVVFNVSNGISTGPDYLVGKVEAIGGPSLGIFGTFQTNFTFLNFTSEFNLVSFRCGQLNEETIQFTLGLPGKKKQDTACHNVCISYNSYSISIVQCTYSNSS